MHDEIKRFSLDGQISEANVVQTKERMINMVEGMMREYGFVPALDMEPQFTLSYDAEEERFDFSLSVYGIRIEESQVWQVAGIMGGKRIQSYSPQRKSMPSLKSVN